MALPPEVRLSALEYAMQLAKIKGETEYVAIETLLSDANKILNYLTGRSDEAGDQAQ